jgi:hypothetical protein
MADQGCSAKEGYEKGNINIKFFKCLLRSGKMEQNKKGV